MAKTGMMLGLWKATIGRIKLDTIRLKVFQLSANKRYIFHINSIFSVEKLKIELYIFRKKWGWYLLHPRSSRISDSEYQPSSFLTLTLCFLVTMICIFAMNSSWQEGLGSKINRVVFFINKMCFSLTIDSNVWLQIHNLTSFERKSQQLWSLREVDTLKNLCNVIFAASAPLFP